MTPRLLLLVALALSVPAAARSEAPAPGAEPARPATALGPEVPRGAMARFLAACREGHYARAAEYLNLRQLPQSLRAQRGAELARELETDYGYRRMDTFMVAARERGAVGGGHRVEAPGWLDSAGVVTAALGSTETTAQVQPARFTTALIDAATTRGATLRIGVVEEIAQRDGAARGVRVGSETIEADAVVLAMGPWTSRAARGLRLPAVHGLKGYSVTLAGADVPAHALFVDYRTADGRALEPEIFPRPDGETYVCGMADPAPLPESAEGVEVNNASCEVLARAAGRVSTALAAARIIRRQACYRPVTDDGLPLIGRIPGVAGAYVATGHGPWGMLNAPATGLALSELIADGAASLVDLRPFDPARRR